MTQYPTPLHELSASGQSIWLDYIDRTMLHNGELQRRISSDALTGMTSNPTIFEKALASGSAYDDQLRNAPDGLSAWDLFELVEMDDVRTACDAFMPVFESTKGADGYVSIEVSPGSAHNADATVEEAHRLWKGVNRPNVMIKVPGTSEGCVALRRLIGDGINVNVTLLFAVEAHAKVIENYIAGLEDRAARGGRIDNIASVASFFVSRVDSAIDAAVDGLVKSGALNADKGKELKGRAAVANARRAYTLFTDQFSTDRWKSLAARGARVQRPLWASTSTKNPEYRDVLYVEELIGPDTVNTMPPATLEAFRDHGIVRRSVDADLAAGESLFNELEALGISLSSVTDRLLAEGLASFQSSFDSLIAGLEKKSQILGRSIPATG